MTYVTRVTQFQHWLQDMAVCIQKTGPLSQSRIWPFELRATFGSQQLLESWTGEGVAFARYHTESGALFAKYLGAGQRQERVYRRLEREIYYLRELAPLASIPYAPLLHWAQDTERLKGHIIMPDLTQNTVGWGFWQTDEQKSIALLDTVRLLADFQGFWATQGHKHLKQSMFFDEWDLEKLMHKSQKTAEQYPSFQAQEMAEALPELFTSVFHNDHQYNQQESIQPISLAHGDIHAGQILWPQPTPKLSSPTNNVEQTILIDYGQVHISVLSFDLMHLLGTRLDVQDREKMGAQLRQTYLDRLQKWGICCEPSYWKKQEQLGAALNALTLIRQKHRLQQETNKKALSETLARAFHFWQEVN